MEPVGIGLLGIGNVGNEVFSYLRGVPDIRVLRIARKRVKAPATAAIKKLVTGRAQTVIDDPAIDIIVEITGDAERGAQYILDAIDSGKHVVTANKAAIAVRWRDIMSLARKRGVSVGFEATVGGGMPVVRVVQRHDANDEVQSFAGILNGTCNFILGRMKEYVVRHMDDPDIQKRSLPLEDALAEAQRLGYAEPDPTMDINGFDTKFKVAILANLAFDSYFDPNAIYCEGIWDSNQRILASDFYFLHHQRYLGGKYALKLVGVADRTGRRPTLRVHPALIETEGPLADLGNGHLAVMEYVRHGDRVGMALADHGVKVFEGPHAAACDDRNGNALGNRPHKLKVVARLLTVGVHAGYKQLSSSQLGDTTGPLDSVYAHRGASTARVHLPFGRLIKGEVTIRHLRHFDVIGIASDAWNRFDIYRHDDALASKEVRRFGDEARVLNGGGVERHLVGPRL